MSDTEHMRHTSSCALYICLTHQIIQSTTNGLTATTRLLMMPMDLSTYFPVVTPLVTAQYVGFLIYFGASLESTGV